MIFSGLWISDMGRYPNNPGDPDESSAIMDIARPHLLRAKADEIAVIADALIRHSSRNTPSGYDQETRQAMIVACSMDLMQLPVEMIETLHEWATKPNSVLKGYRKSGTVSGQIWNN
jgi:hypothetical protein